MKVFDGKLSKEEYEQLIHKGYLEDTCALSSSEYRNLQKLHGKETKVEIYDGTKIKVKVSVSPDSRQLSKGSFEVDYKIHAIS
jgi:hypothetical protein